MKAKKFSIFLLTTLMMLFALPFGAFAATRTVTPTSTASITIENALPTDELSAYKVLDITYNDATNSLSYAWNSDFADYFAGTTSFNANAYTVEAFAALADDSDALKDLLANQSHCPCGYPDGCCGWQCHLCRPCHGRVLYPPHCYHLCLSADAPED